MADPTLGEAVTGGFVAFFTGIGAALRLKRNGNGSGFKDNIHELDKRVALVERDISGINDKLDDIKGDISAIRTALGGNN